MEKSFFDRHYRHLLLIPILLFIFSGVYLVNFYQKNNDILYKDISITGGTSVTIYDSNLNQELIKNDLSPKLENINLRIISDLITQEQKAIVIETTLDGDSTRKVLEEYLGYNLTEDNSSFEFTDASLGKGFYKQLLFAIFLAFLFMGIVIFVIFRTFVPSMAVIFSAFADILMALVCVDIFGIKMSSAGLVAFLMLIGYSVDTDVLLTTRVLKRTGKSLNQLIFDSFKTGMTMTLTSIFAIFLLGLSFILYRIY